MRERWRTPAEVLDIGSHPTEVLELGDGRLMRQAEIVLAAESIERMRSGYLCANCLEPFESAFPEVCPVCGVRVREQQAAFFAREFGGIVPVGSSVTLAAERQRLRDFEEET